MIVRLENDLLTELKYNYNFWVKTLAAVIFFLNYFVKIHLFILKIEEGTALQFTRNKKRMPAI